MPNNYFHFKQFTINQEKCAMKVTTDGVILGAWVKCDDVSCILDIGTGTGLLALMLAQRCQVQIDAIDIDTSSCLQAIENVKNSKWFNRIKVINTSIQEYSAREIGYDLIICNPPYFSNSLKSPDEKRNRARHNDTLSNCELLECVKKLISEEGKFALILPYKEGKEFADISMNYGLYCNRAVNIKPYKSKDINRVVMELSRTKQTYESHELIIRNDDGSYTQDYKNLTRDYYLH